MSNPSKKLELGVNNLLPSFQKNPPDRPKFFHFTNSVREFHEADVIIFKQEGKPDLVLKDRFSPQNVK
jgi:hypothetical protein